MPTPDTVDTATLNTATFADVDIPQASGGERTSRL